MSLDPVPSDMVSLPVRLRVYRPSDRKFILASWFSSHHHEVENRFTDFNTYKIMANVFFRHMLATNGVIIACNPEDEDQIYGWVCGAYYGNDDLVLHWIYVKHAYRMAGVGRLLVETISILFP